MLQAAILIFVIMNILKHIDKVGNEPDTRHVQSSIANHGGAFNRNGEDTDL
jgi:hypothetical protein